MSIVSNDLKSNFQLGKSAFKMGLHRLLCVGEGYQNVLQISLEEIEDPLFPSSKIFGDIYESIIAAICITKGLTFAFNFFAKTIIGEKWSNNPLNPRKDPKSELLHAIQANFPSIVPSYIQYENGEMFHSTINIGSYRLPFIGESTDRNKADMVLSSNILREIENDPNFFSALILKTKEREAADSLFINEDEKISTEIWTPNT